MFSPKTEKFPARFQRERSMQKWIFIVRDGEFPRCDVRRGMKTENTQKCLFTWQNFPSLHKPRSRCSHHSFSGNIFCVLPSKFQSFSFFCTRCWCLFLSPTFHFASAFWVRIVFRLFDLSPVSRRNWNSLFECRKILILSLCFANLMTWI